MLWMFRFFPLSDCMCVVVVATYRSSSYTFWRPEVCYACHSKWIICYDWPLTFCGALLHCEFLPGGIAGKGSIIKVLTAASHQGDTAGARLAREGGLHRGVTFLHDWPLRCQCVSVVPSPLHAYVLSPHIHTQTHTHRGTDTRTLTQQKSVVKASIISFTAWLCGHAQPSSSQLNLFTDTISTCSTREFNQTHIT